MARQTTAQSTAIPDPLDSAPPQVSEAQAQALMADLYGIHGEARSLACERDANFRIITAGGSYTLKIANPAETARAINFQTEAFRHAARRAPHLPLPRVMAAQDGRFERPHALPDGRIAVLRVLTWVDGTPLARVPMGPQIPVEIGTTLAHLGQALADFTHPGTDDGLLWNIANAPRLRPLLPALDPDLRGTVTRELDGFDSRVAPVLPGLRRQVIHNDMNHHNLVVDEAGRISGVLDFGDMARAPLIIDVAVAAAYLIPQNGDPLAAICQMLQGYQRVTRLLPDEIALLRDLIVARLITSLTISGWRAQKYPANAAYILRNRDATLCGMNRLATLSHATVTQAFRAALA